MILKKNILIMETMLFFKYGVALHGPECATASLVFPTSIMCLCSVSKLPCQEELITPSVVGAFESVAFDKL